MTFFSTIEKLLSGSVGNNLDNEEEDVRRVRKSFEDIDFVREEESEKDYQGRPLGIITRGLDETIKDFQAENNLRVDGYMTPGGETETALSQQLQAKKKNNERPQTAKHG